MDWALVFIAVGVAHALLLACYAAVSARRGSWHAWIATLFALLAVAMTAILVTHRTEGWTESIAIAFEEAASWFVGPVLFAFLRVATDRPLSRRWISVIFGAAGVLVLAELVIMFMFGVMPPPWLVVAYLACYSLAGAVTFARHRTDARTARAFWWPVAALVLMFSIHAAQIVRMAAPEAGQDAVPVISAMGASLILLAVLLAQARTGDGKTGPRYARSTLTRPELERIHTALIGALNGPPPLYRKLDLSLADLSAAAGVPAHHASQALSEVGRATFYELVTQRRLAEAQQRLLEPANANVAVEALGMEAGFRSRSAFYAAFKSATGLTPAEFRRRGGEIMSKTAG